MEKETNKGISIGALLYSPMFLALTAGAYYLKWPILSTLATIFNYVTLPILLLLLLFVIVAFYFNYQLNKAPNERGEFGFEVTKKFTESCKPEKLASEWTTFKVIRYIFNNACIFSGAIYASLLDWNFTAFIYMGTFIVSLLLCTQANKLKNNVIKAQKKVI